MKKRIPAILFLFSIALLYADPSVNTTLVAGYIGTLYRFPPMAQFDYYLETPDKGICGIQLKAGATEQERQRFFDLASANKIISVEGILQENVIAPNGRNLIVTHYKVLGEVSGLSENIALEALVGADSSFIENIRGRTVEYLPENMTDGELATCWVEGKDSYGIGETLRFILPREALIDTLKIDIGFDRSDYLFYSNSRVKAVRITLGDTPPFIVNFRDVRGLQEIEISPPQQSDSVILEILDVYPGTRYRDTCISEVEIWGRW